MPHVPRPWHLAAGAATGVACCLASCPTEGRAQDDHPPRAGQSTAAMSAADPPAGLESHAYPDTAPEQPGSTDAGHSAAALPAASVDEPSEHSGRAASGRLGHQQLSRSFHAHNRVWSTTDAALRQTFERIIDGRPASAPQTRQLLETDFVHVCTKELDLDLSEAEVSRLFRRLDEEKTGVMNFDQFRRAVRQSSFLKTIASNYHTPIEYVVPADFDYMRATCEQYRHPSYQAPNGQRSTTGLYCAAEHGDLYGRWISFRQRLDYTHHVNYCRERQLWQDQLISNVVVRTTRQQRPWLVFTCGAMGSGKGYALSWCVRPLLRRGCLAPRRRLLATPVP
jgi:hypothetical protein